MKSNNFEFIKLVDDILDECENEQEIKKRVLQLKVRINQISTNKITYIKYMEEFENENK